MSLEPDFRPDGTPSPETRQQSIEKEFNQLIQELRNSHSYIIADYIDSPGQWCNGIPSKKIPILPLVRMESKNHNLCRDDKSLMAYFKDSTLGVVTALDKDQLKFVHRELYEKLRKIDAFLFSHDLITKSAIHSNAHQKLEAIGQTLMDKTARMAL